MEKDNKNNLIKIKVLEIFPSYEELNPNKEEILIIFQGLNIFLDLQEMITTDKKIEIENNKKSSIIVSLIKSNNIYATGHLNIKQGEQWVTLNYGNKNKKQGLNLALNLIDCIKMKISCECPNKNMPNINNSIININTNAYYSNRNHKGKNLNKNKKFNRKSSPPKDLFNNLNNQNQNTSTTTNKDNIKKIDLNLMNKTRNSKNDNKKKFNEHFISLREGSMNNFGIKKMNTSVYGVNTISTTKNNKNSKMLIPEIEVKEIHNSKKVGGSPGMPRMKKLNNNIYNVLNENHSQQKTKMKNNLKDKIKNSNNTKNNQNVTNNSSSFNYNNTYNNMDKNAIKNKLHINFKANYNKNYNQYINYTINSNSTTTTKHNEIYNFEGSINSSNEDEKEKNKDIKNVIGLNTGDRAFMKLNNDNINDTSQKILIDNIEENNVKNTEQEETEEDNDEYNRIKEDFNLMYNDEYLNNIQDDLLKLEIELFIEKMTELISCYHAQLEEKKIENEIFKNKFKLNFQNFNNINKLIKKLNIISFKKQRYTNLFINKNEIDILKSLFNDDNNKHHRLKDILVNNILKKEENKKLLYQEDKYKNFIMNNLNNKGNIRKKIIPLQQKTQIISNNCSDSSFNNSSLAKNNNSFYVDNNNKKIYKKKAATYLKTELEPSD